MLFWKDACTPVFIEALFIITEVWKQPVSITRWMGKEDVVYMYNRIVLNLKKELNFAICSYIDGVERYYAKWHKLEKDKILMISLLCGI